MKAITLLSGGLDSFVSTSIARRKHRIVLAITFDYGQRAARREIAAAVKICKLWKIKHKVIKLPWLARITDTALVNKSRALPFLSKSALRNKGTQERSARAVWVPNRNGLFINIAASFAESLDAELIITGFNKEEAATFPDNSAKFVKSINGTLKLSTLKLGTQKPGTLKHPKVISFTQRMAKLDMARYALSHDLPIEFCWPCYEGGKNLCGRCESCIRFFTALRTS